MKCFSIVAYCDSVSLACILFKSKWLDSSLHATGVVWSYETMIGNIWKQASLGDIDGAEKGL